MSAVLVGPLAVRGRHPVRPEVAAAALGCVDDPLALLADRAVPVDDLLGDAVTAAVGPEPGPVTLVTPSWWPARRIARVARAARAAGLIPSLLTRSDVSCGKGFGVLEVGVDVVAARARDGVLTVQPRAAAAEMLARLRREGPVRVDDPAGDVFGELACGSADVELVDDDWLLAAVSVPDAPPRRIIPRPAVTVTAAVAVTLALAAWQVPHREPPPAPAATTPEPARTWLVEGRVAVEVPAGWQVRRLLDGPGSPRLQVVSPEESRRALLVVQSPIPDGQSMDDAARVLRAALEARADTAFTGWRTGATVADRPAVTYSETRGDRLVDWTVVLDGGVRIAIGCQRPPDVETPSAECLHAVATARSIR